MVKKAGAGLMVEGREVKSQELHAVERGAERSQEVHAVGRGGEPGTACRFAVWVAGPRAILS